MKLVTLITKLYETKQEIFCNVEGFANPILMGKNLSDLKQSLNVTDEFYYSDLYFIDAPMFLTGEDGLLLKDSSYLGEDIKFKFNEAQTFLLNDLKDDFKYDGNVFLYTIELFPMPISYAELEKFGPGVYLLPNMIKTISNDMDYYTNTEIFVKFNMQKIQDFVGKKDEDLINHIKNAINKKIDDIFSKPSHASVSDKMPIKYGIKIRMANIKEKLEKEVVVESYTSMITEGLTKVKEGLDSISDSLKSTT